MILYLQNKMIKGDDFMNKVNELVLCRDEYNSQDEFENEIKKAVMLLLNANQIMTIRYDEKGLGIIVIEYKYADQSCGYPDPYWLLPDEIESIIFDDEKENSIDD